MELCRTCRFSTTKAFMALLSCTVRHSPPRSSRTCTHLRPCLMLCDPAWVCALASPSQSGHPHHRGYNLMVEIPRHLADGVLQRKGGPIHICHSTSHKQDPAAQNPRLGVWSSEHAVQPRLVSVALRAGSLAQKCQAIQILQGRCLDVGTWSVPPDWLPIQEVCRP